MWIQQTFIKCLLGAEHCAGPWGESGQLPKIELSPPPPQGTHRCVHEFLNNHSRGERNAEKGEVFQCTCQRAC